MHNLSTQVLPLKKVLLTVTVDDTKPLKYL